ncbi:MAG: hypothetical protein ACI4I6_01795 [Hominimerdicola sp.]
MKVFKKIMSTFLGLLFVVLIVAGVIVATYAFNQPSRVGDSRKLIDGIWTDEEENVTFVFSSDGDFKMYYTDTEASIAQGYFKVDEDAHQVKLLVFPKNRDESVDINYKLKFFTTLSYTLLEVPSDEELKKGEKATCSFIYSDSDEVYKCERTDNETNVYHSR